MSGWKRTYRAVYAANLITAVGMMSFLPFFPSYLEELGVVGRDRVALWSGLVFGAAPLAAAVMGPIWGSIGDRFSRKLMVIRAMVAISVFVGSMSFVQGPWQLLALRLGQGVFSGFVPPSVTLVSVAAPGPMQGRIAGSLPTALAAGSIVGPMFGAFVQDHLGMRAVFLVVAGLSGLGALLVLVFAREEAALRETVERWSPTSVLAHAWGDLARLFRNPRMRAALLLLFVIQFGVGATNPLLELHVRDVVDDPERAKTWTGILFGLFAGASLVAMPLWGRLGDRIGHGRALGRSALGAAVALVLHAPAPGLALLAAARVALGLTSSGATPATFGTAAVETPVERRGSAMGAAFSARALAVSVGAMAGGGLAALLTIRGVFVLGAVAIGLCLLLARPARVGGTASGAKEPANPHI